ncbi:DUF2628 domain-containing protein [Psychrobacillus sp. FSL W7-1493]|uniref:DUF2628 domain-containing protein n=1 Tax=Psychrobacillus sp. FSL W7-1493 TaxID=2921552 RepID=UPI0030FC375F
MANKNYPELDESLHGAFVGASKWEYYSRKWNHGLSWNWAAFFLSFFWLGYRKMYAYIFTIFGLFLLYDIIIVLSGLDFGPDETIGITAGVVCGILGNNLYLMHANRQIKRVTEQQHGSEEFVQSELQLRGGTSWLGVLAAFGLLILYGVLAGLIYGFGG